MKKLDILHHQSQLGHALHVHTYHRIDEQVFVQNHQVELLKRIIRMLASFHWDGDAVNYLALRFLILKIQAIVIVHSFSNSK